MVDEWFNISPTKERTLEKEELCRKMQKGAQDLVNHYVRMQGNIISQVSINYNLFFRTYILSVQLVYGFNMGVYILY